MFALCGNCGTNTSVTDCEFILVSEVPVPADREQDAVLEAMRLREEEARSEAFLRSLLERRPGLHVVRTV